MLGLVSDENFDNFLVRRLLRRFPDLDLVRVQDVGLLQADDETILEWAAKEGRILLTHDLRTVPSFAYNRINKSLPMPGVFLVPTDVSRTAVFDNIVIILSCSEAKEWENQIIYLPI
jgi:predicted nuclease of predicted toxin-antitoxin system